MSDAQQHGACAVWDLTIAARGCDHFELVDALRPMCKKFVFQLEQGERSTVTNPDGYQHYQGRFSLHKKCVRKSLVSALLGADLTGFHVSPSSSNSMKGEAFYCMKTQTKIDGPWTDKDEPPRAFLPTVQKMDDNGLLPWQEELLQRVDYYDDRTIHVVIDRQGDIGKSAFCKYVWAKKIGQPIPPMNKMEDLVQFCIAFSESKLFVIDMPRAMRKKDLFEMYAGIETIKNGMLYDKRYKGTFKYIPEPNIIVFTNAMPKLQYLSLDRWKMWTVKDKRLEVYKWHDHALPLGQTHDNGVPLEAEEGAEAREVVANVDSEDVDEQGG